LEGVRLARALAREGVPVTLSSDAALMGQLEDVDLVVVGADAFVPGGFANKVGTSALARLARLAGRSFIVLADTEKILPLALAPFFRLPTRAGREIARAAPGLTVENPYFDCTPYRLVSGVVTEKGRTSIGELRREMRSIAVSTALVRALERRRSSG
jgi:methylthioribose-1-phosphate isomerase